MDPSGINVNRENKFTDLNKLVIGFLSIVVPLSSCFAGCATYQFMNYSNTKSYLTISKRSSSRSQKETPRASTIIGKNNNINSFTEKRKSKKNESFLNNYKSLNKNFIKKKLNKQVDYNQTEDQFNNLQQPEKLKVDYDIKNHNSINESEYLDSNFIGNTLQVDKTCIIKNNSSKFLNPIYEQINFFKDKFNLIALVNLILSLISMLLQVIVFKSLVHSALVDEYSTNVYDWPQVFLIVVNFLISTGTRVYFARLASTMLRSPKRFLILSLVLLLFSLIGMILQTILVDSKLQTYAQIKEILKYNISNNSKIINNNINQNLDELEFFFDSIKIHKILLNLSQLIWIGPVVIWDILISFVLLFNFFDVRKRCRFGSVDGKLSLAITLMLETLFLATIVTCIVSCGCLVLGSKLDIDFQRLSTIQFGFDSIIARLHSISLFCSLQHRVNDGIRLAQNLVLNSRTVRDSTLSGIGSRGTGGASYGRRHSRIGSQSIRFPDCMQDGALDDEHENANLDKREDLNMNHDLENDEIERINQSEQDYRELDNHEFFNESPNVTSINQYERSPQHSDHENILRVISDNINLKTPEKVKSSFNKSSNSIQLDLSKINQVSHSYNFTEINKIKVKDASKLDLNLNSHQKENLNEILTKYSELNSSPPSPLPPTHRPNSSLNNDLLHPQVLNNNES